MATEQAIPIFWESLDDIRAQLRLSGVPLDSDAAGIFEDSVAIARLTLFDEFSADFLTDLAAEADTPNFTTPEEHKRYKAKRLELLLIWRDLMQRMPVLLVEASNRSEQQWNEEAPFRDAGAFELERNLARVEDQIAQLLDSLKKGIQTKGPWFQTMSPTEPLSPYDSINY